VRGRLGGPGEEGALILAAVFMGLNYVAIKVAVVSVPPLLIGAFRFVLGGSCSLESCASWRR
jgi:drug/metabolite transporter (DMT)-like permease